jgi:hypothetical protein
LTGEHKEKLKQSNLEKAASRKEVRARCLQIAGWNIFRSDSQNVVLQKGDSAPLYYPDFPTAIQILFKRIAEPKADTQNYLAAIANAESNILKALSHFSEDRLPTLTLAFEKGTDDGD